MVGLLAQATLPMDRSDRAIADAVLSLASALRGIHTALSTWWLVGSTPTEPYLFEVGSGTTAADLVNSSTVFMLGEDTSFAPHLSNRRSGDDASHIGVRARIRDVGVPPLIYVEIPSVVRSDDRGTMMVLSILDALVRCAHPDSAWLRDLSEHADVRGETLPVAPVIYQRGRDIRHGEPPRGVEVVELAASQELAVAVSSWWPGAEWARFREDALRMRQWVEMQAFSS